MMKATLGGMLFASEPIAVDGVAVLKLVDIDNWYSSAPVRADISNMPLSDGGFAPARTYRSPKTLTIKGFQYGGTAQRAVEDFWQAVAALAPDGRAMTLTVEDESSVVKTMTVYLTEALVAPFRNNSARFSIQVTAPDPRKYGPSISGVAQPVGASSDGLTFPLFENTYLDFGAFSPSGLFYVTNEGTAESWPVFTVRGQIAAPGFQILSAAQTIQYSAALASGVEVLLSPYAGGRASLGGVDVTNNLTKSEWPSIAPGETRLYVFNPLGVANANARLTTVFSSAWW